MSVLPPDDPHGDRAWQEEQRRKKGRGAILDAEEWRPHPPGPDTDDDDDAPPGEPEEDALRHDHVLIPRIFGKAIRQVPISLPDDCPVTPLGKLGRTFFYLSPLGELITLTDAEHGQAHIAGLWAPRIDDLNRAFPQFNQQGKFQGFRANYARDAMISACASKGLFEAHDKVRGRGCWKGDHGELIQHLGDRILIHGREHKPGEIDGFVYPGRPPLPAPKAGGRRDCEEIYNRLCKWNWDRGELDARLLLGQQASTVLSAAIDWRPMGFICGDASTGKSTLQRFVRGMLPGRLLATVDASEAALRGLLGQDAVGVSFDEIEADATNDKAIAVMKLARTAASGDDAHRSSASQEVKSFTLRGSFLFSAIVPPSMRQADSQRFAFLRLQPLPRDAKLEELTRDKTRDLGAGLVGRITEGWSRWPTVLQAFTLGLARVGHAQRGALQFGTLLAAAHIALHDSDPSPAEVDRWCAQLRRDDLFEYENSVPAWLQAWRHILAAQPDVWRQAGSPTVAEMIRSYFTAAASTDGKETLEKCKINLERAGLAIVHQRSSGRSFLAIPATHQAIAAIFAGTDFQKRGGEGAWNTPLRGAPKIADGRGVLHVDHVRRLSEQKCALFWLDGTAEVNGAWISIFDHQPNDDFIADDDPDPDPGPAI